MFSSKYAALHQFWLKPDAPERGIVGVVEMDGSIQDMKTRLVNVHVEVDMSDISFIYLTSIAVRQTLSQSMACSQKLDTAFVTWKLK